MWDGEISNLIGRICRDKVERMARIWRWNFVEFGKERKNCAKSKKHWHVTCGTYSFMGTLDSNSSKKSSMETLALEQMPLLRCIYVAIFFSNKINQSRVRKLVVQFFCCYVPFRCSAFQIMTACVPFCTLFVGVFVVFAEVCLVFRLKTVQQWLLAIFSMTFFFLS